MNRLNTEHKTNPNQLSSLILSSSIIRFLMEGSLCCVCGSASRMCSYLRVPLVDQHRVLLIFECSAINKAIHRELYRNNLK